nr:hypothetical protein Iba_chr04bCG14370 [Ipomoea batatas]
MARERCVIHDIFYFLFIRWGASSAKTSLLLSSVSYSANVRLLARSCLTVWELDTSDTTVSLPSILAIMLLSGSIIVAPFVSAQHAYSTKSDPQVIERFWGQPSQTAIDVYLANFSSCIDYHPSYYGRNAARNTLEGVSHSALLLGIAYTSQDCCGSGHICLNETGEYPSRYLYTRTPPEYFPGACFPRQLREFLPLVLILHHALLRIRTSTPTRHMIWFFGPAICYPSFYNIFILADLRTDNAKGYWSQPNVVLLSLCCVFARGLCPLASTHLIRVAEPRVCWLLPLPIFLLEEYAGYASGVLCETFPISHMSRIVPRRY